MRRGTIATFRVPFKSECGDQRKVLTEAHMAAWTGAVGGLLIGLTVGDIFVPAMIRSVPGVPVIEDLPTSRVTINTVLVFGFAVAVAILGYKAIKRMA